MVFQDLKQALKRAEHFTKGFQFGGPFSPIGKEGLSIPIRNGLWFIDLVEPTCQEDYCAELISLHWMACKINAWIDNNLVEGDTEAIAALAAFRSRAWGLLSSSLEEMVEIEKLLCQHQKQS